MSFETIIYIFIETRNIREVCMWRPCPGVLMTQISGSGLPFSWKTSCAQFSTSSQHPITTSSNRSKSTTGGAVDCWDGRHAKPNGDDDGRTPRPGQTSWKGEWVIDGATRCKQSVSEFWSPERFLAPGRCLVILSRTHTHSHTHACAYTHTHTHTHAHTHTHTRTRTRTHTHTHTVCYWFTFQALYKISRFPNDHFFFPTTFTPEKAVYEAQTFH